MNKKKYCRSLHHVWATTLTTSTFEISHQTEYDCTVAQHFLFSFFCSFYFTLCFLYFLLTFLQHNRSNNKTRRKTAATLDRTWCTHKEETKQLDLSKQRLGFFCGFLALDSRMGKTKLKRTDLATMIQILPCKPFSEYQMMRPRLRRRGSTRGGPIFTA